MENDYLVSKALRVNRKMLGAFGAGAATGAGAAVGVPKAKKKIARRKSSHIAADQWGQDLKNRNYASYLNDPEMNQKHYDSLVNQYIKDHGMKAAKRNGLVN